MKLILFIILLFVFVSFAYSFYESQPKFITKNGHLIIESAMHKNITFRMKGNAYLNVGESNLMVMVGSLRNVSNSGASIPRNPSLTYINQRVTRINRMLTGPRGIMRRLSTLESGNTTRIARPNARITSLQQQITEILEKLVKDDCASTPCLNGGTCTDLYDAYLCICPYTYEGPNCQYDVNECESFAGTDLGCQNGATCVNTIGSYECICAPGFVGLHCVRNKVDCLASPPGELCGHGTCVQTNDRLGYNCICEQGWRSISNLQPACTVDVNECEELRPHCSKDPEVICINLPGSFICGPCPAGFSGNGFFCADIDECNINNGGCSTSPMVSCINTRGSFYCGNCPPGYSGDGRICQRAMTTGNQCLNSAFCHPLARCVDYSNSVVECICPAGYTGSGFGPLGCIRLPENPCVPNPCQNNGICIANGTVPVCSCPPRTVKPFCTIEADPCVSSPCQNGGTCRKITRIRYQCSCAPGFVGSMCQSEQRACGGVLTGNSGVLQYPTDSNISYHHNSRCAWLMRVNITKVINVTFTRFDLEEGRNECLFDWLQIHDGRSTSAYMIGRFCGKKLPKGGNIISTHNTLFFWFRSDNTSAHEGFQLTWNAIDPVCGGEIEANNYGIISSPGSPGNYPPNRDCVWHLTANPSKRIQLHFFTMMLEAHETCNYDYLAVHSGSSTESTLLEKFCNTTHPEPLTTPSNEVTLHFHSDEDSNDAGFQIHYTVVEGFPGCGGTFTKTSGEFGSPIQDNTYPHNLVCEYIIKFTGNNRIKLSFKKFELELSSDCKFDSLEIYEGSSDQGELVGRYCGTTLPTDYSSLTSTLLIKFKSDWSSSFAGFRLAYDIVCGGVFSEPTNYITSPLYPQKYENERHCDYTIMAPIGKAIILDFLDMDIEDQDSECVYDFLEIFDGIDQKAKKIGRYCTDQKPGRIVSSFNYLFMQFETDGSISNRGFKANYSFFETDCGGIIKDPGLIIRPPESRENDGGYAHSANCAWIIVAPPNNVIQLTWLSFSLEGSPNCPYDYVELYDNSTTRGGLIGRYCDNTLPPAVVSSENMMTIIFKSDSSTAKEGFSLTYMFIDGTKLCGGKYFTTTGVIRSPGFPSQYSSSKTCEWVITVQTGRQIELNVTTFKLEDHSECRFDYLEVRNGGTNQSPLIGKFCGEQIPKRLVSFSNQMYLKFNSDASRNFDGFEIEWDGTATGCGGLLTSYRGSISSPNYPEPYGANSQCNWRISVNQGSTIQVTFSDLDLEGNDNCIFDYLSLHDGRSVAGKLLGKYCTSENHPLEIQSTTNFMYLRMVSDSSHQGRGFNLRYSTICDQTFLNQHRGVIESPNFPEPYPHNMHCEWKIKAHKGNKVRIVFSHFDLENSNEVTNQSHVCNYDYLEISNENGIGREKFCNNAPSPFISLDNGVTIKFHTDSSGTGIGFRLEWEVDGCGGILTHPTGEITSPNYPKPYPLDTACMWIIQTDYGNAIELTIQDVNLEKLNKCVFDGLTVSNEPNFTHPIVRLCESEEKPTIITSSGHELYVGFYSDSSHSKRGFNATYRVVASKCGGRMFGTQGTIMSPNYPNNYGQKINCEWLIETQQFHTLTFNIQDFDLEYHETCDHDAVMLYDGSEQNEDNLIFRECTSQLPNVTSYVSKGNQLLLVMRSDDSIEAKGFKVNYTISCGAKIITNSSGEISLHGNKANFVKNCSWTIMTTDPSQHVTLTVTHFVAPVSKECLHSVRVYDGDSSDAPLRQSICAQEHMLPITSNGQALTVDILTVEAFFDTLSSDFHAHYSIFDNACGGTYKSTKSIFSSPGYPQSYPANVECQWNILLTPGSSVSLVITFMDIAESENCNQDYLEIREGDSGGKLLGVFCGKTPSSNLTSQNNVWVKFHSSAENIGKGFLLEYEYLYISNIYASSGAVMSPLYPKFLVNPGIYQWRLNVEFGSVISISISDFIYMDIEQTCSTELQIFDGYDEDAPLLTENVCNEELPTGVMSSSNVVYIQANMLTNFAIFRFSLTWTAIDKKNMPVNNTGESKCGGQIVVSDNDFERNISSPGYPYGYDASLNCSWILSSGKSGSHPAILFTDIDLEEGIYCNSDYVEVLSSYDLATWKHLDKRCSIDTNYLTFYHGTPYLRIDFHSDYYVNRTGFNLKMLLDCGGVMNGPNGAIVFSATSKIFSPRYFDRHNRISDVCKYNITVRPGKTIQFQFESMHLPKKSDSTCEGYVIIKNGIDDESPLLGEGKYCGNELPTIPMTSSNRAFVKFLGGMSILNEFKLTYHEVGIECGGSINLYHDYNSTIITSPNYPSIPHPHSECTWTVLSPPGELIRIDFVDRFDLTITANCDKEYVELRDGGTTVSRVIGVYCSKKPPTVVSTSNMVRLKFFTNVPDPKNGFKAKISIATCGGVYNSDRGSLLSTNYPAPYPENSLCEYHIIGPVGRYLNITFVDMDLPYDNCSEVDHISIYNLIRDIDGNATEIELGTFCGDTLPPPMLSFSNEVILRFTTLKKEDDFRGYKLNFASGFEKCGGTFIASTGVITSPGYPDSRQNRRFCEWYITVPKGQRVKAEFIDFDLVPSSHNYNQRIGFYNDHFYTNRIKFVKGGDIMEPVYSSDNKMFINMWIRQTSGHRGFKLVFSSDEPTICEGNLNDREGIISAPQNSTVYYCEYRRDLAPLIEGKLNVGTLVLDFTNLISKTTFGCRFGRGQMSVKWISGNAQLASICGITSKTIRSPFPDVEFISRQSSINGPVNYTLRHKINDCGGMMLNGGLNIIKSGNFSDDYGSIDCAWYARYDTGVAVNLEFKTLDFKQPCDKEYIIIYNGPNPLSPQVNRFCGTTIPTDPIKTEGHLLFIEYHADTYDKNSKFKLQLSEAVGGCGGILHKRTPLISSPGNKAQYPNNIECIWEIRADPGYLIGLSFINRFYIEDTKNCTKDYLEIFDYRNNDWLSLGRVCGRETPKDFFSSGTKMKLLFRSDDTIAGDGFNIEWRQICGGTFNVDEVKRQLFSPGFPQSYGRLLNCEYIFEGQGKKVINIEFKSFELEEGSRQCKYDNVTIYKQKEWVTDVDYDLYNTYCGKESPGVVRAQYRMKVILKTDRWVERKGFQLEYSIDNCGFEVNNSSLIESPESLNEGDSRSTNCEWKIIAPSDKKIVIRFESFYTEHSDSCYFDYVDVFAGLSINETTRLALLCGNLTNSLPVLHVEDSNAFIRFHSDYMNKKHGFKANIMFVESCNKRIFLTGSNSTYVLNLESSGYDPLLDCSYEFSTTSDNHIALQFNHFHLAPCVNQTDKCSCDFLEIRDGFGPFAELIGKYCGHDLPFDLMSSGSGLWIRFVTDMTLQSTGFVITATLRPSICGPTILNVTKESLITIQSPGGNNYPPNARCLWTLKAPSYDNIIDLHFEKFDLQDADAAGQCTNDKLEIVDENVKSVVSEGLGTTVIYRGLAAASRNTAFYSGLRSPQAHHHYCGSGTPSDYYSGTNKLHISFKSDAEIQKSGFKITAKILDGCHRNYTSTQGRIMVKDASDCEFYIIAPPNHTLSIYFSGFFVYEQNCNVSRVQINENGPQGKILATLCGYAVPNPVFLQTNVAYIRSFDKPRESYFSKGSYDFTYLATDRGIGCGGQLFNYGGVFSSPWYPANNRSLMDCRWDIIVPQNLLVGIRFAAFDMGPSNTCETNYIQFIDIESNGNEKLARQFCGSDRPAPFKSSTNSLVVRYRTTVNFGGTGWLINFVGVHPDGVLSDY